MNRHSFGLMLCILASSYSLPGQHRIVRNTPLESGTILEGERIGVWSYSDYPGKPGLVINYDTREILYLATDSSEFVVQEGGRWVKEKLLRPCRLHGPKLQLFEHYMSGITAEHELRSRAKRKQSPIVTRLTFEVGPDGTATNPVVSGYKGFGMEKLVLSAFQSAPNVWIPGVKTDGTSATCRFGITIAICPEKEEGDITDPSQVKNLLADNGICPDGIPDPDSVMVLYRFNPREIGLPFISQYGTNAKDSQYGGLIGKTSSNGTPIYSKGAVQPYAPFASVSPRAYNRWSNSYEVPLPLVISEDTSAPVDPSMSESSGIEFSPDGKRIAVDASLMTGVNANGLLVVSADNSEFSQIDYGTIMNAFWLDDFNVAFKYKYGNTQPIHALYDRSTGVIAMRRDSTTYSDRISPDRSMIGMASRHGDNNRVSILDLISLEKERVRVDESLRPRPISWSPDQKAMIMMGSKDKFIVLIHYDLRKKKSELLPIVDAEPCGWSSDGTTLYAMRINERNGELFSINTQSLAFEELFGTISGLRYAEFSHKARQFLLLRKGKLYLHGPQRPFKPVEIMNNVSAAAWSPDGKQIVYVSENGTLLSLYEMSSGRSKILINRFIPVR